MCIIFWDKHCSITYVPFVSSRIIPKTFEGACFCIRVHLHTFFLSITIDKFEIPVVVNFFLYDAATSIKIAICISISYRGLSILDSHVSRFGIETSEVCVLYFNQSLYSFCRTTNRWIKLLYNTAGNLSRLLTIFRDGMWLILFQSIIIIFLSLQIGSFKHPVVFMYFLWCIVLTSGWRTFCVFL